MGIYSSSDYSDDSIDKFGLKSLDKYGEDACIQSEQLRSLDIAESSIDTYIPQVRQVLSYTCDEEPLPDEVVQYIWSTDKSSSSKDMMISAMAKYYIAIDKPSYAESIREIASSKSTRRESPDTSNYITKSEVESIADNLFPEEGQKSIELTFSDKSWIMTAEHKAIFLTIYHTRSRVGELFKRSSDDDALCTDDIDVANKQIKVYRSNGNSYARKSITVSGELIRCLTDYIQLYDIEEGPLFDFTVRTAQNRIKEINELYKHAYGQFENASKLSSTALYKSKADDRVQMSNDTNDAALDQILDKLNASTPEEALDKIDVLIAE